MLSHSSSSVTASLWKQRKRKMVESRKRVLVCLHAEGSRPGTLSCKTSSLQLFSHISLPHLFPAEQPSTIKWLVHVKSMCCFVLWGGHRVWCGCALILVGHVLWGEPGKNIISSGWMSCFVLGCCFLKPEGIVWYFCKYVYLLALLSYCELLEWSGLTSYVRR